MIHIYALNITKKAAQEKIVEYFVFTMNFCWEEVLQE